MPAVVPPLGGAVGLAGAAGAMGCEATMGVTTMPVPSPLTAFFSFDPIVFRAARVDLCFAAAAAFCSTVGGVGAFLGAIPRSASTSRPPQFHARLSFVRAGPRFVGARLPFRRVPSSARLGAPIARWRASPLRV